MDFFTQNASVAFWGHLILLGSATYVITNVCTKFQSNSFNTFDAVLKLLKKCDISFLNFERLFLHIYV